MALNSEFLVADRLKVNGVLDRAGWGSGGCVFYNCLDANWRHVLAAARQTKVDVAASDDLRGFVPVLEAGAACKIPITDAEL